MALVDGFLELERSSGKLEWSAILQKMASDLGFSKILFGLLPKDSQDYENAFIVGNYPAAWREHYDRAGYARVDPTVSHCTQSVLPIFWEPSIYQTRKQHEFFEEASAAGLVYGLTMPLHGARGELGALSLSVEAENRAEANRFMESVLPTLWMLKDYALQSGAGLAFEHPVSKPVVLTSREKEVLQWCAIGKTSWEISVICNSEQGFTVDLADNGIDGRHLALHGEYDVIVLDVMLPGVDGYGVLRALRERRQTPVIMLTARERVEDRVRGLREGADDYLIKPFSFLELVARLQALTRRGGNHESHSQMRIADLSIDLLSRKVFRGNTRLELTAKEYALLCVLAQRSGEILSKTAIAELVWDINFDTDTNVVEVAIKRLRAKLDGPFENKLLHTIRGMGYVLENRALAESG